MIAQTVRINLGMQGARRYLALRGVAFETHNPAVDDVQREIATLTSHARHKGHKGCREAIELLKQLVAQAHVVAYGHRVRTFAQARELNGYRSGPSYRWVHRIRNGHFESAVRREDGEVFGPFADLNAAKTWIGHHGGGYLLLDGPGSGEIRIPDRGAEDQLPLLRAFNDGGGRKFWGDYLYLENHPRA